MTLELIKILSLGLVSFVATNIDDFLLLVLLFSTGKIQIHKIIIGQYLGMFTILILSYLTGTAGLIFLPPRWIGILGLVPLIVGLQQLFHSYCRGFTNEQASRTKNLRPNNLKTPKGRASKIGIFAIMTMTLANGGDNIAVYSGLFAEKSKLEIFLLIIIYLVLTAFWCLSGFYLSSQGRWTKTITRFHSTVSPIILVLIGIIILTKLV